MNAIPQQRRLTLQEYLAWSESQDGRYELIGGEIVAQAAERAAHAAMKGEIFVALRDAIGRRGLDCHALPDGMAVRIGDDTAFEPDAQVYCGPRLLPDALWVENPVIVVEVLSPTTGSNDVVRKLAGYFAVPSVAHYLIVDPDAPLVLHHQRSEGGQVLTNILRGGALVLDPPGLELHLSELYGASA